MPLSPLLNAADSVLALIDMQTVLAPKIVNLDLIINGQQKLIAIARELKIPQVVTEQYVKGIGPTLPVLVETLGPAYQPLEKLSFSAFGAENFRHAVEATGRKTLVLMGIESHICVLQTALEAAAAGFDVHVVPDAISARSETSHHFALEKFKRYRVELDTVEMVAYQWLRKAGTPEFKNCLPYFKT